MYEVPARWEGEAAPAPLWQAELDSGPPQAMVEDAFGRLASSEAARDVEVVGHRIVHGGFTLRESTAITPEVRRAIETAVEFAPEHNGAALAGIDLAMRRFPKAIHVAVLDSAFHATLPLAAALYAVPFAWYETYGLRRLGFHGLSHGYCATRAAHLAGAPLGTLRIVTAHLGNGCSLAAIDGGTSVDTTMGFTPMDGIAMGARSGSVDPGILLYVQSKLGLDPARLDRLLNEESGLRGLSGVSNDLRKVTEARERGEARAGRAIDVFVHRLQAGIGAMIAALGGFDAISFTGGIGEHSAEIRERACANFAFLGLQIDATRNRDGDADREISATSSKVRAYTITAREEYAIAREAQRVAR